MNFKQMQERREEVRILIDAINLLLYKDEQGHQPMGYGNFELNKATDALYEYMNIIRLIEEEKTKK